MGGGEEGDEGISLTRPPYILVRIFPRLSKVAKIDPKITQTHRLDGPALRFSGTEEREH